MGETKCYKVYYLKGVTGVYLEDEAYMWDNLTKAIEMKPELKEVLATDVLFLKYSADEKYQALVK